MRTVRTCIGSIAAASQLILQVGCTSTPSLSEITGTEQSPVFIKDVVQRIKCEITEAFDDKLRNPDFRWLSDWTAHVDLTLTINDNAGIGPNGSYQRFQNNAVNFDAGPSSFPASASRAVVNQFLTVSAGATLSGQAIRTETVSFTLSLAELELWRQGNAKLKPAAGKICDLDRSRGITGNLGLGEWVNSAVHPAETGDLTAGIHTATGAKATAPSVPSPGRSASGSASGITVGELSEQLTRWSAFLDDMDLFLTQVTSADDFKKLLSSSPAALKAALEAADKYNNTLAPYLPAALKTATSNLKPLMRAAGRCYVMESHFTSELTQARKYIDALVESLRGEDSQRFIDYLPDFRGSKPGADNFKKLFTLIHKIEAGVTDKNYPRIRESGYARALMQCDAVAKALNRTVAALPKQIDPPIDAMLHSVTFVISYGANITPNWTLIQWKGPGQSPNLLSGSGVRTHGMVIAIGPPGDSPKIGPDATRLINLQAVRALNQQ